MTSAMKPSMADWMAPNGSLQPLGPVAHRTADQVTHDGRADDDRKEAEDERRRAQLEQRHAFSSRVR